MDSKQILSRIKIVSDTEYVDNLYGITPEIRELLTEMAAKVAKKKNSAIKELNNLIKKYPGVPAFRNYLSTLYEIQGNTFMSEAVNIKLRKLFPEYIQGFANEINIAVKKGQEDIAFNLINQKTDIQLVLPNREAYHYGEVIVFYHTLFNYFIFISNAKQASICKDVIDEVVAQFNIKYDTSQMQLRLYELNMDLSLERQEREFLLCKTPEVKPIKIPATELAPTFTHQIISELYCNSTAIDSSIIDQILALPHNTLFEDLKKVLYDSMARKGYFEELEWKPQTHSFLLHTLFLLAEIQDERSLPLFLDVLRNDNDYLELWMGDYLTDSYWNLLYPIAKDKLADLYNYVIEPNGYTYAKSVVSQLLEQVLLYEPERKQEIIDWFRAVFRFWLNNIDNDDIIDNELIAFFVSDVVNVKLVELIPDITILFDKNLVATGISGDKKECLEDIEDTKHPKVKHTLHTNISERYDHYLKNWNISMDEEDEDADFEFDMHEEEEQEYASTSSQPASTNLPNIGRNDPCPCGSGKKYKKCCMK